MGEVSSLYNKRVRKKNNSKIAYFSVKYYLKQIYKYNKNRAEKIYTYNFRNKGLQRIKLSFARHRENTESNKMTKESGKMDTL